VKACQIGTVTDTGEVIFETREGETRVVPKFRESAYTKVKEVVGEETPTDASAVEERLKNSLEAAKQKRSDILEFIQANRQEGL
jgi:hydrogenase expression/formation protein